MDVDRLLDHALGSGGPIVWLTGAGISAESGIPTFRGEEGYWTVGSRNYRPMELATQQAFSRMPDDVWAWYLYRRAVCRAAAPNAAHQALADLEPVLDDRFLLITQNVDGLHPRAGNSAARTYQIHGNIDLMRCTDDCGRTPVPIPDGIALSWERGRAIGEAERALLRCEGCGGSSRPHVLWFDEYYDEAHFRFESSLAAAARAALLVVVGTTGGTNLPLQVGAVVARRGAPLIAVNPEPNPFSELASGHELGLFLEGTAGEHVPAICRRLAERVRAPDVPRRYALSSWLFLRALGLVYLVAFLSFWADLDALLTSDGIGPAAELLAEARARPELGGFAAFPSLLWWGASDAELHGLLGAGRAASLLLVAGFRPWLMVLACAAVWLSIVSVSDPFIFQWDTLLCEAGLVALFVAPLRSQPRPDLSREPPLIGRLLVYLLVFRVVFCSGVVKLRSGDPTWQGLTALTLHYETQPLPHLVSFYVHQLPDWFHAASCVVMFVIELLAPFFLLWPGAPRRVAALAVLGLMIAIMATGNYGWFNVLVMAMLLLCVDDDALLRRLPSRLAAWLRWHRSAPFELPDRWWVPRLAGFLAAPVLFFAALQVASTFGARRHFPEHWNEVIGFVDQTRSINGYGLFAVMTIDRPEIVIEGSMDGVQWEPYELRYKPGDPARAPVYAHLHMPRVDWRLWFAAFGNERWVLTLLRRIQQGSPGVLDLMERNPFPDEPPRYLRAVRRDYRFMDLDGRAATGLYWRVGAPQPYSGILRAPAPPPRR